MVRRLKPVLLTALTFALVGPPFGTLAFSVWGLALEDDPVQPLTGLLATLWMLPFGYMIGLAPAALTGLVAGLVRTRLNGPLFVAVSAAAGFAVTWALAALTASGPDVDGGGLNLGIIGAIAGAGAALASWALGRKTLGSTNAGPAARG